MSEMNPSDPGKLKGSAYPAEQEFDWPVEAPRPPRRGLFWTWFVFAIVCILALSVWVALAHSAMNRLEKQLQQPSASEGSAYPSERQQQIRAFETRLARVLGASVESKLRTLERSVERGSLSADELRLLESAASELRLLQTNPAALDAVGSVSETPEHPRFQPLAEPAAQTVPASTALLEISRLRNLYHASLVTFTLFALMLLGLWLGSRRRYRLHDARAQHQIPVFRPYQEERER